MASRASKKRAKRKASVAKYVAFREGLLSGRIELKTAAPALAAAIEAELNTEQI